MSNYNPSVTSFLHYVAHALDISIAGQSGRPTSPLPILPFACPRICPKPGFLNVQFSDRPTYYPSEYDPMNHPYDQHPYEQHPSQIIPSGPDQPTSPNDTVNKSWPLPRLPQMPKIAALPGLPTLYPPTSVDSAPTTTTADALPADDLVFDFRKIHKSRIGSNRFNPDSRYLPYPNEISDIVFADNAPPGNEQTKKQMKRRKKFQKVFGKYGKVILLISFVVIL